MVMQWPRVALSETSCLNLQTAPSLLHPSSRPVRLTRCLTRGLFLSIIMVVILVLPLLIVLFFFLLVQFSDLWRDVPKRGVEMETDKKDSDLDSLVSSEGLDQISPPSTSSQPKIRSFSQSVTITKVVAPDGSVEERRTVRDSDGNEETTVTRSRGSGASRGSQKRLDPPAPDIFSPSDGLQDDFSIFSKFFGGFKR
ncbi:hypothetical protein Z043_102952 [Scleropages formosus]|uniref:Uncharacterized protein n=1 Tax=Scleropages formosus TaxID=113540 RepID=A0A0P7UT78_SCLFO|nr:hypothetical protein Z043_102952 [Scleropages formosus]